MAFDRMGHFNQHQRARQLGSDTSTGLMQGIYIVAGVSVLLLTIFRIMTAGLQQGVCYRFKEAHSSIAVSCGGVGRINGRTFRMADQDASCDIPWAIM
jgi:hypothetical protein